MSLFHRALLIVGLGLPAMAAASDGKVHLDDGTVADFDAIDGVSTDTAQAIVALRTERGSLHSVEELRILPGIDGDTLDVLRRNTGVTVDMPMGSSGSFSNPSEVLGRFDAEPTVQDTQRWANDYANTSPDLVARWLRQSRLFAALPQVTVEYTQRDQFALGYDYLPTDGFVDTPNEAVYNVLNSGAETSYGNYRGRLVWDLNELILSSERIRVISEVQDVVKLRDKVLTEATTVYFERRRLQVEMLLNPKADLRGQVIDQLRLMELTANLDAVTGGMFSARLQSSGN